MDNNTMRILIACVLASAIMCICAICCSNKRDSASNVLFENIECLANGENVTSCFGSGSLRCGGNSNYAYALM